MWSKVEGSGFYVCLYKGRERKALHVIGDDVDSEDGRGRRSEIVSGASVVRGIAVLEE